MSRSLRSAEKQPSVGVEGGVGGVASGDDTGLGARPKRIIHLPKFFFLKQPQLLTT